MSTKIRPEISKNKTYYISKHRYYELKHFCLQYREWKQIIFSNKYRNSSSVIQYHKNGTDVEWKDPTSEAVAKSEHAQKNVDLVKNAADETDPALAEYILKAVTEGYSYNYLKLVMGMPCGRNRFYISYHKFFWILDKDRSA